MQRAGIDLRSLPYAFITLDRIQPDNPAGREAGAPEALPAPPPDLSHVIGRVEHYKPYARLLNCDAHGLAALPAAPALAQPTPIDVAADVKVSSATSAVRRYRGVRNGIGA